MNKKDLVAKLKQLEGLTPDERAELINLLNTKKKYGLVWEDKPEDVEEQLRTQLPILREVVEKRIIAKPSLNQDVKEWKDNQDKNPMLEFDTEDKTSNPESLESFNPSNHSSDDVAAPNHILIEGDNLHALTALTFTHEGKIDVIYIDPPYNTGNKDFKYNDAFVDKEDSYRHSKWLSFMHKRLEIAKRLLSDKGVIFISIDDNEIGQLRILCDDIFEERNLIAQIIVISNSAKNNANYVSVTHEYLLCYSKNIANLDLKWQVKKNNVEDFKKISNNLFKSGLSQKEIQSELRQLTKYPKFYDFDHYVYIDKKGPFRASDLTAPNSKNFFDILHPITQKPCKTGTRGWANSPTGIEDLINEERILFGDDEMTMPQLKNYLSENEYQLPKSTIFFDSQSTTKWIKSNGFDFAFPKAIEYIEYILTMYPSISYTILDFFAGSGTTLHATMQLNAEDGGNRQCILVTNNENNICEEVTYERNKRVIEGYTNAKGVQVAGLTNNKLRYYRSEYVGREHTHKNKRELVLAATELLCIKEDIYTEYSLNHDVKEWKDGQENAVCYFDLTDWPDDAITVSMVQKALKKQIRVFSEKGKNMMIIYDEEVIEEAIALIKYFNSVSCLSFNPSYPSADNRFKIYIFAPGQYPFTEEFEDVLDKVELCALPDAIYKAYANVLPKKKRLNQDEDENSLNQNGKGLKDGQDKKSITIDFEANEV